MSLMSSSHQTKDQIRGCKKQKDKDHMEFLCGAVRSANCVRSLLRAGADVRSEFEHEVRDEVHGHAGNEDKKEADLCILGVVCM